MKKAILSLVLVLSALALSAENVQGLHCGTRGSLWGTIASDFVIPDYFPPENPLLRAIFMNPFFMDLSICEVNYSPVNLGLSCVKHDQCYATLGKTKDGCDDDLLQGWQQACSNRYGSSFSDENASYCASTCEIAADLMYKALRYQVGDFCPSCRAFERSQKRAQNNLTH